MSRSPEEQQLLDQRMEAMKRKNEELRRRHMEVEADKKSAAKQNALVQMKSPHDDDWVPGSTVNHPEDWDRQQASMPAHPSNRPSYRGKNQRTESRRSWNEGHQEEGFSKEAPAEDTSPKQRPTQSHNMMRRRDWDNGNENRRSGEWTNRPTPENPSGTFRRWGGENRQWSNRSQRNDEPNVGDGSKPANYSAGPTVTSKVFKNSSMDSDRGRRPVYRLAEGDGPPPDPSYSFLGDSMRDSREGSDNRRDPPQNRRGFRGQRGFSRGRSWNNQVDTRDVSSSGNTDLPPRRGNDERRQQSYEAWRKERNQIDQERINRQKTSDGNWSREWDSNKILQDDGRDRPVRRGRGGMRGRFQARNYQSGTDDGYSGQGNTIKPTESQDHVGPEERVRREPRPRRGRTQQRRVTDQVEATLTESGQSSSKEKAVAEGTSESKEETTPLQTEDFTSKPLLASVVHDSSGTTRRSVEDVGKTLRISLTNTMDLPAGGSEQKPNRKLRTKGIRPQLTSCSSATTVEGEDEDGSWEDVSSEEENQSIVLELHNPSLDYVAPKTVDISSGPESLDPIPAPGKEDEFLWDDFHPAGFQDNMPVHMDTESAYKEFLEQKAKEGKDEAIAESECLGSSQPPTVSFRLDTACLEDSGDEQEGAKLDPLLVTTQIVQAEVDCMSFTSITTDASLPDEFSLTGKSKVAKEDQIIEEEVKAPSELNIAPPPNNITAEELSGPMSIMEVQPTEQISCDSDTSFKSVDSPNTPQKEVLGIVTEVDVESTPEPESNTGKNQNSQTTKEINVECAPKPEVNGGENQTSQKTGEADIKCAHEPKANVGEDETPKKSEGADIESAHESDINVVENKTPQISGDADVVCAHEPKANVGEDQTSKKTEGADTESAHESDINVGENKMLQISGEADEVCAHEPEVKVSECQTPQTTEEETCISKALPVNTVEQTIGKVTESSDLTTLKAQSETDAEVKVNDNLESGDGKLSGESVPKVVTVNTTVESKLEVNVETSVDTENNPEKNVATTNIEADRTNDSLLEDTSKVNGAKCTTESDLAPATKSSEEPSNHVNGTESIQEPST